MFRLIEKDRKKLIDEPETGMGYQLIEAEIGGKTDLFFVFNCELLVTKQELADVRGKYFVDDDLKKGKGLEPPPPDFKFLSVKPLSSLPPPTGDAGVPPTAAGGAPPTIIAPSPRIIRNTDQFEGFARVSAFSTDHRVTTDKRLTKNTYATTIEDLKVVPSGFAASGRYALPNPAAARYVYIVVPGAGCPIDGGTVRPAHHQSGGGVEVKFVNGTPEDSVFKPYRIPEI